MIFNIIIAIAIVYLHLQFWVTRRVAARDARVAARDAERDASRVAAWEDARAAGWDAARVAAWEDARAASREVFRLKEKMQ